MFRVCHDLLSVFGFGFSFLCDSRMCGVVVVAMCSRLSRPHEMRRTVSEYVKHYQGERNHQGLNNQLIAGAPVIGKASRVRRRPRLGGLLNFYERAA